MIPAEDGSRFLVNPTSGDIRAVSGMTELIWLADPECLIRFLDEHDVPA